MVRFPQSYIILPLHVYKGFIVWHEVFLRRIFIHRDISKILENRDSRYSIKINTIIRYNVKSPTTLYLWLRNLSIVYIYYHSWILWRTTRRAWLFYKLFVPWIACKLDIESRLWQQFWDMLQAPCPYNLISFSMTWFFKSMIDVHTLHLTKWRTQIFKYCVVLWLWRNCTLFIK